MSYKPVSVGLGIFSIALGAAELLAPGRIARALGVEDYEGVVRGFGAREVAAGMTILAAPAAATPVWGRVAGDVLDLGALGAAAVRSPRNPWVWGAIGFVVGATVLDALTARGLDQETGKTLPVRAEGDVGSEAHARAG